MDYVENYIDATMMKTISECSNATSLARGEEPLGASVDEIYHFFGACILMSCVSYPQIRMYWSKALRFPAIAERFTRDRFFRLRQSIKVLLDDDVPEVATKHDRFWKVRPFLDRVLQGCRSQARTQCVSVDEQMIPFTGACPFRQYLPTKPNPVGMKNFVCATPEGVVLDFEVYQGADALSRQVRGEEGVATLGSLVLFRLAQTLPPGTRVYCDRFFTTVRCVEDMMAAKQVYLTGTVMKNRVAAAVQKLPSDRDMKRTGRGSAAQVTSRDGRMCIVKWYDNKPVMMISAVHGVQPEDTCQRWDKKLKRYVTVARPSVVREYNSKMGGVDLVDRMMSYYRMDARTNKWTFRMIMHFTDLALANSWLLYRQDLTTRGAQRKNVMQFLEFRMDVAKTFLSHCGGGGDPSREAGGGAESSEGTECGEGARRRRRSSVAEEDRGEKRRRPVQELPHVSARRRANAHLPEVIGLKNAARCRAEGCSGKSRVQCSTCKVFLCLQTNRNCYSAFHS